MSLSEDEVVEVVQSIWDSMLGVPVGRSETPLNGTTPSLSGTIQITGSWEGGVTLICTEVLARRAASIMFDLPQEELSDDEIQDSVGELINMIGGNIKSLISDRVGTCKLSLPTVAQGTFSVKIPGSRSICSVNMECEGEPFKLNTVERKE